MLGRMFGHEFHALLIFQKFLIADDFAALFGFWPPTWAGSGAGIARIINPIPIPAPRLESLSPDKQRHQRWYPIRRHRCHASMIRSKNSLAPASLQAPRKEHAWCVGEERRTKGNKRRNDSVQSIPVQSSPVEPHLFSVLGNKTNNEKQEKLWFSTVQSS